MERRAPTATITTLVLSLACTLAFSLASTSLLAEAKVARLGWLLSNSVVPTPADLQKRNAFLTGQSGTLRMPQTVSPS